VDAKGAQVVMIGNTALPIFPRSAIKPLQALPFVESGAADRFGRGPADIAIACGSHSGTELHVSLVKGLLARAGLTPEALGCGVHEPFEADAARELVRTGARPSSPHHNCSGKHAAMLATAVHLGEPIDSYWLPDHPVQVRVRRVLEEMTGCTLTPDVCGIDGCSVPNWAVPPTGLSLAFARLVTGTGLPAQRAQHCARILAACVAHTELMAGPGRFDTLVMQRLPGKVLIKAGAEGVTCGGLPEFGLGFALKIDDGAKRATEAVAAQVVAHFYPDAEQIVPDPILRNWRGRDVGRMRATQVLADLFMRR
jgi:L-asparaginase II